MGSGAIISIDDLKNGHPLLFFALLCSHNSTRQTIIKAKDKMFEDYYHDEKEAVHSGSKSRPGGKKDCSELFAIKV
jgi:hypothetical protein